MTTVWLHLAYVINLTACVEFAFQENEKSSVNISFCLYIWQDNCTGNLKIKWQKERFSFDCLCYCFFLAAFACHNLKRTWKISFVWARHYCCLPQSANQVNFIHLGLGNWTVIVGKLLVYLQLKRTYSDCNKIRWSANYSKKRRQFGRNVKRQIMFAPHWPD